MIMNIASKKIHFCHFDGCKASFSRPYKLDFHIKKHNGEKPFTCSVDGCSKSYTTPSHLKRHNITAHEKTSQDKEILCKICGISCSNKYNFKKHFSAHHASDLPYKCSQCTKEFKKKKQLLEHMCIHSGEHPYRCEICNNGFNKIHLLNKHKRNHKTYTCDCGETFHRWSIFCAHRKNSCSVEVVDHKCVICSKIFTTKSNLKMHSLIHVDESQLELFHCPYKNCNRSYKYKKNASEHIKAFHKKSKQKLELNCTEPDCQTVLSTYVNLKRHLINVHNTKFNKNKTRKTRSDKGKTKKSAAAILSGIKLAKENQMRMTQSVIANSTVTHSMLGNESLTNIQNTNENNESIPKERTCTTKYIHSYTSRTTGSKVLTENSVNTALFDQNEIFNDMEEHFDLTPSHDSCQTTNMENQLTEVILETVNNTDTDTNKCIDSLTSSENDLTSELINNLEDCLESTDEEVLTEISHSTTIVAVNTALSDQNEVFNTLEENSTQTSSHDSCQTTNLGNQLTENVLEIVTNADPKPTVSFNLLDHCNTLVNAESYITSNNIDLDTVLLQYCSDTLQKLQNCSG